MTLQWWHQRQLGVQYVDQGYIDMQTRQVEDWTTNLPVLLIHNRPCCFLLLCFSFSSYNDSDVSQAFAELADSSGSFFAAVKSYAVK